MNDINNALALIRSPEQTRPDVLLEVCAQELPMEALRALERVLAERMDYLTAIRDANEAKLYEGHSNPGSLIGGVWNYFESDEQRLEYTPLCSQVARVKETIRGDASERIKTRRALRRLKVTVESDMPLHQMKQLLDASEAIANAA
jgi:hypothetical protein